MSLNTIGKTIGIGMRLGSKFIVKHLPTILTAVGTVGVCVGTVMAAKKAPEAKVELDKVKAEWEAKPDQEKTNGNKADYVFKLVRVGTRYYGIVIAIVGGSIVCFWVANHINLKRLSAAMLAAKISSEQLKDLENKIREKDGDKTLQQMKDEINMEKMKKSPIDKNMVSSLNYTIGECVVWDPIMKHPFPSSAEKIRRAIAMVKEDLTEQLIDGETYAFTSYSDFLEWAGCDISGPVYDSDAGTYLGFAINSLGKDVSLNDIHQLVNDAVDVSWTSAMLEGEVPMLALKYGNPPRYQYKNDWDTR